MRQRETMRGGGAPFLYASVGPELTRYALDVDAATLDRCETVTLPANVQYAWPHVSGRLLYIASSNGATGLGSKGDLHHLSAFRIDADGALSAHGAPIPLPQRPIHIATDLPSHHVLAAFSNPGALRVYRIHADGTLAGEVAQRAAIDPGIYPHQVRPTPDGCHVILVARGHDAHGATPEEPGALKLFTYTDGQLTGEVAVAPGGGFGFGPRHLDFHPARPFVFVSLERQNALAVFGVAAGQLSPAPLFTATTLAQARNPAVRQIAGTVHVHPNGRFVYVANRASDTIAHGGQTIFAGGENTFAVYAIDEASGKPRPIQHIDSGGIHCRTFHIDPSGRVLVAAHITGLPVKDGSMIRNVPARLVVFRIGEDGRLELAQSYDVDVDGRMMFWMGIVAR